MSVSGNTAASQEPGYLVCEEIGVTGPAEHQVRHYLESPRLNTCYEPGHVRFSGWAFDPGSKTVEIGVRHGGELLRSIPVGLPRPDVSQHFGDAANASHSGFSGVVPTAGLPECARLELEACLEDGRRVPLGSVKMSRRSGDPETALPHEAPRAADTSQHGEAEFLRSLLGPDFPRFIVDVGAHDGYSLSNSYSFIQEGWTGLLFEPLPSVFTCLVETHIGVPNAICVNKACADRAGTERFYLGSDGALGMNSTLCRDDNEWFAKTRTDSSIEVEVATLADELTAHGFPADFSLLLVDAEGMDYEVLLGLDLERFRPRIILTEEYPQNREKHEKKYDLLSASGYVFRARLGCNSVWIRHDLAGDSAPA